MDNNTSLLPKRTDIDDSYKWRLYDIYANEDFWNGDYEKVKSYILEIQSFNGKLSRSSENLLKCLQSYDKLSSVAEKLYVYAKMKRDEDNTNSKSQELAEKADSLLTEVSSHTSFITPEIISIPEEKLTIFFQENKNLELYQQHIKEIIRQKKHILSSSEEQLLAMAGDISSNPKNTFTMYNNADLKFPIIKDENENRVELTKGRYISFLESKNRNVRKNAFKTLYKTYSVHKNTLASTLSGNIKCNKFYADARKYPSIIESFLDSDNVNISVYDTLIDTVNKHLPLLKRYLDVRKKALKVKKLHMYDLFVPLFESPTKNISFETAMQTVTEALHPLGSDYINLLKNSFSSGWIDTFENDGKTSGAYSWGAYLTHPYVLLNYQGTLNDVFTLAHEMGHALHSNYTNTTQPYIYSEYKIFVAEVASTVNESLLTFDLLKKSKNTQEKAYILNHFLEEFRGTIFRQVMFAEFEKMTHQRAQNGESLNAQNLSDLYYGLNQKYYGGSVEIDPEISMEWSRIPHFYNSFYVYKYATGMSSAISISKQIINDGPIAVEKYINFLKSGCSDYPLELLKKTGVDLSTPKPIEDAFLVFEENLNKLEECL